MSYLLLPDKCIPFSVFSSHFYFLEPRLFSVLFFCFLDEMPFSHWLNLIALVTCVITHNDNYFISDCKRSYLDFEKQSDYQNISTSWSLSIVSFTINKNASIPMIYSFGNTGHNIYFLRLFFLHKFSNLNLIKYVSCKTFLQNILVLFFSHVAFNLSLIYMKCREQFN